MEPSEEIRGKGIIEKFEPGPGRSGEEEMSLKEQFSWIDE